MSHAAGPPVRSGTLRGEISIADLITTAARLGARDPAGLAAVTEILGLRMPVAATPPGRLPEPPRLAGTSPSRTSAARRPVLDRSGTAGPAVAARLRREGDDEPAPAWLAAVTVLPPPGSAGFRVPPQPLLPPVQARSSMAAVAATWHRGRRLDLDALVRRSARLQPMTGCFLAELRTAASIQLLVDQGEGMQPYADDLDFLARQLLDVAGRDRVEQRTFVGTPRRGLDPDVFTGDTARWKLPAPRSLVLIVTDLGTGGPAGSRDRAPAREWQAVAAAVASAQADLRVLTPFPPGRLPAGLAATLPVTDWDSLAHLVRLRG